MDKFKGVVEEYFQKNPHYQYLMPQSLEAGVALTTEQQVPVMALLHEIAWCIIPTMPRQKINCHFQSEVGREQRCRQPALVTQIHGHTTENYSPAQHEKANAQGKNFGVVTEKRKNIKERHIQSFLTGVDIPPPLGWPKETKLDKLKKKTKQKRNQYDSQVASTNKSGMTG